MDIPEPTASPFEVAYLKHLTLNEKPFGTTPDPAFFFESRSHAEALRALEAFLDREGGLALVYGGAGTGKTLMCRHFVDGIDRNRFDVGLMLNPVTDKGVFLTEVARHFNIVLPPRSSWKEMAEVLFRGLLSRPTGRMPVLAIDDAQTLTDDVLDILKELFHDEESGLKPSLHIILFGREALVTRLLDRRMGHVRRHIVITHYLQALSPEEVGPYVAHRLLKAGSNGLIRFTEDAIAGVYAASKGYPGAINVICDRCLLSLYKQSKTTADQKVLQQVLRSDNMGVLPKEARRPGSRLKVSLTILMIAAALALLCLLYLHFRPVPGHQPLRSEKTIIPETRHTP
jgi:type II secretory pathway predicted ATPase ExeA